MKTATPPPIDPARLSSVIDQGLRWLDERQLSHGEIPLRVGRPGSEETEADSTVFATTQAVYSLSFVDHPLARSILERAGRFLADEMGGRGVWRFWTRRNPKRRGIPPDLDDTCCASDALRRCGLEAPENRAIILGNRDSSGHFYTWLLPRWPIRGGLAHVLMALRQWPFVATKHPFWQKTEAEPGDIDGVVNANVLLYLGERPETRGAVDHLVELYGQGIESDDMRGDKWYLDPCALAYMISRPYFYGVVSLEVLRPALLESLDRLRRVSDDHQALDSALALGARLNLHQAPDPHDVEDLIASRSGAAWPAAPLYYGGPKRSRCWGSAELTTALCLEVLARSAASFAGQGVNNNT